MVTKRRISISEKYCSGYYWKDESIRCVEFFDISLISCRKNFMFLFARNEKWNWPKPQNINTKTSKPLVLHKIAEFILELKKKSVLYLCFRSYTIATKWTLRYSVLKKGCSFQTWMSGKDVPFLLHVNLEFDHLWGEWFYLNSLFIFGSNLINSNNLFAIIEYITTWSPTANKKLQEATTLKFWYHVLTSAISCTFDQIQLELK